MGTYCFTERDRAIAARLGIQITPREKDEWVYRILSGPPVTLDEAQLAYFASPVPWARKLVELKGIMDHATACGGELSSSDYAMALYSITHQSLPEVSACMRYVLEGEAAYWSQERAVQGVPQQRISHVMREIRQLAPQGGRR